MEIPSDGFLIEGHELTMDESAMTGETDPIKKSSIKECCLGRDELVKENSLNPSEHHAIPSPIILSGTKVLTGEGKFIVIVVGDNSCVGKIIALVR